MTLAAKLTALALLLPGVAWAQACKPVTQGLAQMGERYIEIIDDNGESVLLRVKVADEINEQAAGFQHVCPQTIDTTAILFVFEQAKQPLFHMRNVHADLDIAFIDVAGRIGDVQLMREEFSTGESRLYHSSVVAKYALEVRRGFFQAHNISATNSRIRIDE